MFKIITTLLFLYNLSANAETTYQCKGYLLEGDNKTDLEIKGVVKLTKGSNLVIWGNEIGKDGDSEFYIARRSSCINKLIQGKLKLTLKEVVQPKTAKEDSVIKEDIEIKQEKPKQVFIKPSKIEKKILEDITSLPVEKIDQIANKVLVVDHTDKPKKVSKPKKRATNGLGFTEYIKTILGTN